MAVTFTPNIALAKPDDTELSLNWARAVLLADDNNQIIIDKMDVNILTYSPAFIGQFGNPSTGVGSRKGEYQDMQGIIIGNFVIRMVDPGVSLGSGEYGIALPTLADATFHTVGSAFGTAPGTNSCIGEGFITDNSTVNTSGTVSLDVIAISGVHYVRMVCEAYPAKTSAVLGNSTPFGLATGDLLAGSFYYKKA